MAVVAEVNAKYRDHIAMQRMQEPLSEEVDRGARKGGAVRSLFNYLFAPSVPGGARGSPQRAAASHHSQTPQASPVASPSTTESLSPTEANDEQIEQVYGQIDHEEEESML